MPTRPRQLGFTIVELLVTMTILGLMLFLVNELFQDTSRVVSTSVQTSKTIATSRSVNEQLTQDAEAMVGPGLSNDGGYIVIIQQVLNNVQMFDPGNLSPVTIPQVRTDQLLFIRDAEGVKSMTPARANGYGTNFIGQAGDRAKVWYGHALRTLPNGQPIAGATLGSANAGLDRNAGNFIFARQSMLFNPTNVAATPMPQKLSDNTVGFSYAANGYYGSAVNNSGFGAGAATYLGLSDITFQAYGPSGTAGTLLNQLTNNAADATGSTGDNVDYFSTAYPAPNQRLRVNTAPDPDATNYASWAIAQGHSILAQGCSEIIIDFAADLNGDGRIDTRFGAQGAVDAPIHWYDSLRQAGTFTWARPVVAVQPLVLNTANQKIFIFRVDDDTPHPGPIGTQANHSNWPYLIRIRYRLHDTRGRLMSNNQAALRDGLDNDGDGAVDEIDEDKISGRWFERIISVPRP